MSSVSIIQNGERKGKQFDSYEGAQVVLKETEEIQWDLVPDENNKYLIVPKSDNSSGNGRVLEAVLGRKLEAEKKLFCMYTLWCDSNKKEFISIHPSIIKDFGKYATIEKNTPLFLERIKEKADLIRHQMNSDPIYDFINYLPYKKLPAISQIGIYRKVQEDSVHQSEFRICFDMKDIPGTYENFRIMNSDICATFLTKDLINMSSIDFSDYKFGVL
jgi:hypothetical protein